MILKFETRFHFFVCIRSLLFLEGNNFGVLADRVLGAVPQNWRPNGLSADRRYPCSLYEAVVLASFRLRRYKGGSREGAAEEPGFTQQTAERMACECQVDLVVAAVSVRPKALLAWEGKDSGAESKEGLEA